MRVRRDLNRCALNLEVKYIALLLSVYSECDTSDLRIHDMLDSIVFRCRKEHSDAKVIGEWIEKAGVKHILIPGDLAKESTVQYVS